MNSCVRRHVSGNLVPKVVPYRPRTHDIVKCHVAARGTGQKGPGGPPDELKSLAASRCPWVMLRSNPDSMPAWHGIALHPCHELLRPKQPLCAVQEPRC